MGGLLCSVGNVASSSLLPKNLCRFYKKMNWTLQVCELLGSLVFQVTSDLGNRGRCCSGGWGGGGSLQEPQALQPQALRPNPHCACTVASATANGAHDAIKLVHLNFFDWMAAHYSDVSVGAHLPEPELHAALKGVCRLLLPGWAGLHDDDIAVSFIAGGISNALYKLAPRVPPGAAAAPPPPPVAFRVYGDNTEQFVDRTQELSVMRLVKEHGFGPQVGLNILLALHISIRLRVGGREEAGGWRTGCYLESLIKSAPGRQCICPI